MDSHVTSAPLTVAFAWSSEVTLLSQQIERLAWDSRHFAFEVGRLLDSDIDDESLEALLTSRHAREFELVYWFTTAERILSDDVLRHTCGQLVDTRVTYTCDVHPVALSENSQLPRYDIRPVCSDQWDGTLLPLALGLSEVSRYAKDVHFPRHLRESLYREWIRRSVRRQYADQVLAATGPDNTPLGFITLSRNGDACTIGLIAVDASVRRSGLGRSLLQSAMAWAADHSCCRVSVATQADNVAACRLYESAGYSQTEQSSVYHFWPNK